MESGDFKVRRAVRGTRHGRGFIVGFWGQKIVGLLYGHNPNLDFLTFLRLYLGSLIGILISFVYEIIPGLYPKQAVFFVLLNCFFLFFFGIHFISYLFGKGVPSFTKPGFFWTWQGVLKTAQVRSFFFWHGVENGQKQLGAGALQGPGIIATSLILLCFLFGKATWVGIRRSFSIAMGGTYTTKVNVIIPCCKPMPF